LLALWVTPWIACDESRIQERHEETVFVNLRLEPATGKGDGNKDQKGTPMLPDVTNCQRGESMNGFKNKN
jgi:hypothetical protein